MNSNAHSRIDVVDPTELVLHQNLTRLDRWHLEVCLVLEYLRAAGLGDEDAAHGARDGSGHCASAGGV